MALLTQDRTTLAKMTFALAKRVPDKKSARQLTSITNKLAHGNPLGPADRELLVVAVESLLASPLPKLPLTLSWKDYVLLAPAVRKAYRRYRLHRKARAVRGEFQEILARL